METGEIYCNSVDLTDYLIDLGLKVDYKTQSNIDSNDLWIWHIPSANDSVEKSLEELFLFRVRNDNARIIITSFLSTERLLGIDHYGVLSSPAQGFVRLPFTKDDVLTSLVSLNLLNTEELSGWCLGQIEIKTYESYKKLEHSGAHDFVNKVVLPIRIPLTAKNYPLDKKLSAVNKTLDKFELTVGPFLDELKALKQLGGHFESNLLKTSSDFLDAVDELLNSRRTIQDDPDSLLSLLNQLTTNLSTILAYDPYPKSNRSSN